MIFFLWYSSYDILLMIFFLLPMIFFLWYSSYDVLWVMAWVMAWAVDGRWTGSRWVVDGQRGGGRGVLWDCYWGPSHLRREKRSGRALGQPMNIGQSLNLGTYSHVMARGGITPPVNSSSLLSGVRCTLHSLPSCNYQTMVFWNWINSIIIILI